MGFANILSHLSRAMNRRSCPLTIMFLGWIGLLGQVAARPLPPIGAEAHPFPDTTNRIVIFSALLSSMTSLCTRSTNSEVRHKMVAIAS
jgi:hypothetical protein